MLNLQDDIKRKGLISEIVSRIMKLEREYRRMSSPSTVPSVVNLLPFASYNALGSPLSTTPVFPYAATLPSEAITPTQWSQGMFIGATNDAGNYWTLDILATIAGVDTVVATMTTLGMAAGSGVKTTTSFSPTSFSQTNIRFAIRAVKTLGAPSNLSLHGPSLEFTYT